MYRSSSDRDLTIMCDASVFAVQTQLLLLLRHRPDVLGSQTARVAGKDEGVAVQTGAVHVQLPAGVVHGIVIVVRVYNPVVVVWRAKGYGLDQKAIGLRPSTTQVPLLAPWSF